MRHYVTAFYKYIYYKTYSVQSVSRLSVPTAKYSYNLSCVILDHTTSLGMTCMCKEIKMVEIRE